MSSGTLITAEHFLSAAKQFCKKGSRIGDTWRIHENKDEIHKSYIIKETYLQPGGGSQTMYKAEYVVFYNMSYGVPSFSFNIWNSAGVLLNIEEIREISTLKVPQKDFYSIITQQEHPVLGRPYFVMHPCHTAIILSAFKENTKNVIVTFLSLVNPILPINLSTEFGHWE